MALAPLHEAFGVRQVFVVDDAGGLRRRLSGRAVARHPRQRHPVHRRRRAEDRARDARRCSGASTAARSCRRRSRVSAHANRVPVEHGHTVCMSIEFEQARRRRTRRSSALRELARRREPCAACRARRERALVVTDAPDRPQPRRDVGRRARHDRHGRARARRSAVRREARGDGPQHDSRRGRRLGAERRAARRARASSPGA